MKIFLDTNFIIDYFIRDNYSDIAEKVFVLCSRNHFKCCISFLTVANFAYILRKLPKEDRNAMISKMCNLFEIIPNNCNQIKKALKVDAPDFEDILQFMTATDAGCDLIISRNQKDFLFSSIPVLTAEELIAKYEHDK